MTKQGANWRRCLLGAALALFFSGLLARSPGQTTRSTPLYTTNESEGEECKVKLNRIYDAIQEYRKQHQQKFPDRLSDLLPEFISNPNDLLCPFVQKTGDLKSWRERVLYVGGSDPRTSYGYEFCVELLQNAMWRGPPKTQREFKEHQMAKLGRPVVPIVRCLAHRPRLNLGYDGLVYESRNISWEANFVSADERVKLTASRLMANRVARRPVAPEDFPARLPQTSSRHLDLTAHYNALLADTWQGFPGDTLAALPTGLQEFGGVTFDVRGLIQLGVHFLPTGFPQDVEGMKAGQKCRVIHFLHGMAFPPDLFANVARYRIHYADRQVREVPIIYGRHIADWWFDPKTQHGPTEAKVAWIEQNEAAKSYGKSNRLFRFSWDNPLNDVEISSIDLIAGKEESAVFLIAITLE